MKRANVVPELERCVERGSDATWAGVRGLAALYPGIDRRLVERAMRVTFPESIASACRALPDEYVPSAWRVIAKLKTPEALFVTSYGDPSAETLRASCGWWHQMLNVSSTKGRKPDARSQAQVAALLADPAGLAAALARVVRHRLAAKHPLLAVLARDASDGSIDALVETLHHATTKRDESLDILTEWIPPWARGPRMARVVAELTEAQAERGSKSPLLALAARFGDRRTKFEFRFRMHSNQVRYGATRKATAYVALASHALPSVDVQITWSLMNFKWTRWLDGKRDDELGLGSPRSLDDVPRWLAASAKKLKITWDPTTIAVTGTLRGKARTAATAWLTPVAARRAKR